MLATTKVMQTPCFGATFKYRMAGLALLLALTCPAFGRDGETGEPIERTVTAPVVLPEAPATHRFWDRQNTMLFVAVAGMGAADFATTRSNLASGGKELNPVTRIFAGSTPALAANFAGETAGVIGLSYFFHKTG